MDSRSIVPKIPAINNITYVNDNYSIQFEVYRENTLYLLVHNNNEQNTYM